jgi:hypothetical protein
MQGPNATPQAGSPTPLMPAARAESSRAERVPARPAPAEEAFRIRTFAAIPTTRLARLPPALRTANAPGLRFVLGSEMVQIRLTIHCAFLE